MNIIHQKMSVYLRENGQTGWTKKISSFKSRRGISFAACVFYFKVHIYAAKRVGFYTRFYEKTRRMTCENKSLEVSGMTIWSLATWANLAVILQEKKQPRNVHLKTLDELPQIKSYQCKNYYSALYLDISDILTAFFFFFLWFSLHKEKNEGQLFREKLKWPQTALKHWFLQCHLHQINLTKP